jgi:hypothetical protein
MKRKMLALAILLGATVFASSVPRAEATFSSECGAPFCRYTSTVCYCSASSEHPGWGTTCGQWKIVCYQ